MRILAHLDMDCFFAQVEERKNPKLKKQPVVVGADPKKGTGRGVVSTANYEARKFGIHSGIPISWAYRACPKATYLRPHFNLYKKSSTKIREIIAKSLKNVSGGKLEQVGIDEFYLDLSGLKTLTSARKFCIDLKAKMLKNEKLTCSIGLAPNKLIAKIASDFEKPDGLTLVTKKQVIKFLSPLPIRVLPGVGPKTAQILHRQEVKTIGDLEKILQEKLISLFGKWGKSIWEASRGIDNREVAESAERKTLGAQTTFARDSKNPYFLRRTLFDLCQNVWRQIQEQNLSPQMVEVTIRYLDFETHSCQKTLKTPLGSLYQFRQEAGLLLKNSLKEKMVRLLGVRIGKWAT